MLSQLLQLLALDAVNLPQTLEFTLQEGELIRLIVYAYVFRRSEAELRFSHESPDFYPQVLVDLLQELDILLELFVLSFKLLYGR